MIHAGGAVVSVDAGVLQVRSGNGCSSGGGCGTNVLSVSAGVVRDEFVGVLDVALVYGIPSIVNDVVKFIRVASVGAFWFIARSWLDSLESGDRFRLLGWNSSSGCGRSFAFVV